MQIRKKGRETRGVGKKEKRGDTEKNEKLNKEEKTSKQEGPRKDEKADEREKSREAPDVDSLPATPTPETTDEEIARLAARIKKLRKEKKQPAAMTKSRPST